MNICYPDDEGTEILACPDNTCIFLISNAQYFISAAAFSISKPFKSPIYTNYLLTIFMILAIIYSSIIILWPSKFICNILQLYSMDNPNDSYYDERRRETDWPPKEDPSDEEGGGTDEEGSDEGGLRGEDEEEEEEGLPFTEEEYYSFSNPNIKYYLFGLAILNFVVCMIFERLIIPAFSKIWDTKKMDKLRQRKKVEDPNNFTMQELFKLSEKETI